MARPVNKSTPDGLSDPDLTSGRLLEAWEAGLNRSSMDRCLLLLDSAWPDSPGGWAARPIGERDRHLLILHEHRFGGGIEACAECPECEERLDVGFEVGDILLPEAETPNEFSIASNGYEVTFRLPTTADLARTGHLVVAGDTTPLLARCVTRATRKGRPLAPTDLPQKIRDAVGEAMAESDPQADIRISVTCSSCSHAWSVPFDIGAYLWDEVDEWAQRLLSDVHLLAISYGWSESEILGLSDQRRRLYLEMVEA